jgi:hypothetical protein
MLPAKQNDMQEEISSEHLIISSVNLTISFNPFSPSGPNLDFRQCRLLNLTTHSGKNLKKHMSMTYVLRKCEQVMSSAQFWDSAPVLSLWIFDGVAFSSNIVSSKLVM